MKLKAVSLVLPPSLRISIVIEEAVLVTTDAIRVSPDDANAVTIGIYAVVPSDVLKLIMYMPVALCDTE